MNTAHGNRRRLILRVEALAASTIAFAPPSSATAQGSSLLLGASWFSEDWELRSARCRGNNREIRLSRYADAFRSVTRRSAVKGEELIMVARAVTSLIFASVILAQV